MLMGKQDLPSLFFIGYSSSLFVVAAEVTATTNFVFQVHYSLLRKWIQASLFSALGQFLNSEVV